MILDQLRLFKDFDCILGLGNPGKQYTQTPHNLGFLFIDSLLGMLENTQIQNKTNIMRHQNLYSISVSDVKILISKPSTYMNLSGLAVAEIYHMFYKSIHPELFIRKILVVHDDVNLEMHTIKIKDGLQHNGTGGHNGIRHIVDCASKIGCNEVYKNAFHRIRLGCKPPMSIPLKDYVCRKMQDNDITAWTEKCAQFISSSI